MAMKNSNKRQLITSMMSLGLTVTMLTGTTLAWFTDSATSTGNIIQSGTLKVDLLHHTGEEDPTSIKKNPTHKIFNYDQWEPGYTQVETLTIKNEGSLALGYELNATMEGSEKPGTTGTNGGKLSQVIDVYMASGDKNDQYLKKENILTEADGWSKVGTLEEWLKDTKITGKITNKNGSDTVTVALHMREEAGNEYQNASISNINLVLNAKQWTHESDSFGNTYDLLADLEIISDGIAVDKQGNYALYKPEGMIKYRNMMEAKEDFRNKTVYLLQDIDMKGYEWDTINKANYDFGSKLGGMVFDGKGHTVSNLVISREGLFNELCADGTVTFKNVNFDKVTSSEKDDKNQFKGVFVGDLYNDMVFEKVRVSNSEIEGYWGIGAFVGRAGSESNVDIKIKDSHVTNFKIKAPWNYYTSSFVGCVNDYDNGGDTITFEGTNTVNNFTVETTKSITENNKGGSIHTNVSDHPNVTVTGYEVK